MNEFLYIACCMGVAFVVGLVMGVRVGYLNAMEHAQQEVAMIAMRYTAHLKTMALAQHPPEAQQE